MNISKLQSKLYSYEGAIITSPENRRYLTGFASSDGYLIVTRDKSIFLTDSRYIEAAEKSVKGCSSVELLTDAKEQIPALLKKLEVNALYTESERLSVAEFEKIKEMHGSFCFAEKLDKELTEIRRIKSEEEKKDILVAQAIAENAFEHILGFIKEGVTEKEIALELDFFMLKNGAECVSFETIAVSGKNSSMPHGVPTDKKIEHGDFITMDYGAVVNGYHSDMTRTVAVGCVSSKQAQVYETVLKAQLASLAVLKEGIACKAADAAARDIIANAGYGSNFGHGTGHGVGIEIHEAPRLSPKSSQTLVAGDVVTVEPGIYLPGEFGVRIEDMAFITPDGCENLTKTPKSLIIL